MRLRCPVCKAWRVGDRVVVRTARTDMCFRCEPVHARARAEAWFDAELDAGKAQARRWLSGAPLFDDALLARARAAHPWRDRAMVPWADTLDVDIAAQWLLFSTEGGHAFWPPANSGPSLRLVESLRGRDVVDSLDIGAVFGERGFPYPRDPTHHILFDDHGPIGGLSLSVTAALLAAVKARRAAGEQAADRPLDAALLPPRYDDVLALELDISPAWRMGIVHHPDPRRHWEAIGSVFRDDTGRMVVLWR